MIPRLNPVLLGVIWAVSGALMTFNPPPHDFGRAAALPMLGVITMVGSLSMMYRAVKEIRTEDVADSGRPPRHASGNEASVRDALKLVFGCVPCVVAGTLFIRWGILRGLLSLVGLGLGALGPGVLAIPQALPVLRRLVRGQP